MLKWKNILFHSIAKYICASHTINEIQLNFQKQFHFDSLNKQTLVRTCSTKKFSLVLFTCFAMRFMLIYKFPINENFITTLLHYWELENFHSCALPWATKWCLRLPIIQENGNFKFSCIRLTHAFTMTKMIMINWQKFNMEKYQKNKHLLYI